MRLNILLSAACILMGIANAQPGSETEGASISGRVLDAYSGIPIAGAMVYLIEAKTRSAVPLNDSALTDATGKYGFNNLAFVVEKGMGYVLRVKAQRYVYTQTNLLNVDSGQVLVQDFNLERILSLSLVVRDSSDWTVLLSGAQVALFPPGKSSSIRSLETDSQGRVGFTDLAAGNVILTIAMKGYLTLVRSYGLGENWEDTAWATLRKDSAGGNLSLQGTLKTRSGKLAPGVRFFFQCHAVGGTVYLFDTSGSDGRFSFEGIPGECSTGAYFLNADSASVTLTGTSTQADFIVADPPTAEVRRTRTAPSRVPAWTRWFRDFNLLGRKRI